MNTEKIYNILSYILFIIACMTLLMMLPFVFMALSNPTFLISAFFIACIILYSFITFRFNRVTVQKKQPSKASTKAMININGFISLFTAFQILFTAYMVFSNSSAFMERFDTYYNQLPTIENAVMPSKEMMLQTAKVMYVGMCIYAAILIAHVLMSFNLLKKYKNYLTE